MPRDWSDADKVLFGISVELSAQTHILGKAHFFTHLRKQLELDKSRLEMLHVNSEIRTSKKEQFKGNVEQVSRGGLAAHILLPFIEGPSDEPPKQACHKYIELFILCCYSFKKSFCEQIKEHGLDTEFADLVIAVIESCAMHPAVVKRFTTMIEEVCGNNVNSKILLDACKGFSQNVEHPVSDTNDRFEVTAQFPTSMTEAHGEDQYVQTQRKRPRLEVANMHSLSFGFLPGSGTGIEALPNRGDPLALSIGSLVGLPIQSVADFTGSVQSLSALEQGQGQAALRGDVYELTIVDLLAIAVSRHTVDQICLTDPYNRHTPPFVTIKITNDLTNYFTSQRTRIM